TQPPSLLAITPLSVIKDPWLQQWPGGVYNGGFTKQWLTERDNQSSAGGTSWVSERIEGGDKTCRSHLELREQNIDFQAFGRSLVHRPALSDARDLSLLVSKIKVPVFLTGAWQDEQTGPQFADMLGNFTSAPVTRFTMFNGRHPDGYTPIALSRWLEFLQLFVSHQVPHIDDGLKKASPGFFEEFFGTPGLTFADDRFPQFGPDQYDEALAAYKAEPDVRVIFENGAGGEVPGAPVGTFDTSYPSWPPPGTTDRSFYLDANSALSDTKPAKSGADRFANDIASGEVTVFGKKGYELMAPTWDLNWTRFADGDSVSYVSNPFAKATVLGGPGYAELHLKVPDKDADVQVSLSIVRADGTEWHVTSGLLRLSDRMVDAKRSKGLQIERTYAEVDSKPMPADDFAVAKVALPSFAQAFRPGDRLEVTVSSPGRDFAAWAFDTIGNDGTARDVGRGGVQASRIVVGVLPGIATIPDNTPPCPSLRGQACRVFEAPATATP
ncbi:MAG: CocE/NonD family hydrolase C-terminal non-catalytic domain-containing protein, partial [Aquihabitans sp.]